ncbi:MAG TPA: hypothetical protein VFV83_09500, partial [Chthoniobacteraceae bacterium]|nr:hypothetical protein [Chthoniobacteraceae bacterium]
MATKKILAGSAFVVASLLTLVAILYVVEDLRGRVAWREYQATATARGVRLRLPEYLTETPPVDENFAAVPLFADLFSDLPDKKNTAQKAF